ncbi:MAG: hypothetical protein ABEH43_01610, partial [Flavobacteriales bacterium]
MICGYKPDNPCDSLKSMGLVNKDDLLGKWKLKHLERIECENDIKKVPDFNSPISIEFNKDSASSYFIEKDSSLKAFHAGLTINGCDAGYSILNTNDSDPSSSSSILSTKNSKNNSLKINIGICTAKGGSSLEMSWENRIIRALDNTKCYTLTNNNKGLFLYYNNPDDNKNLMYFESY